MQASPVYWRPLSLWEKRKRKKMRVLSYHSTFCSTLWLLDDLDLRYVFAKYQHTVDTPTPNKIKSMATAARMVYMDLPTEAPKLLLLIEKSEEEST